MMKPAYYGTLAIIISALFYFLSNGVITGWGVLMWFAPLPILLYAFYFNAIPTFLIAFIGYLLGNALAVMYGGTLLPTMLKAYFPIHLIVIGTLGDAFIFALIILLTRWLMQRLQYWICIFSFPALWTTYEFFVASISPSATNGFIAYTQILWLSLIQIAAITGIWGITFLLTLVPTALAYAWFNRHNRFQAVKSLQITFGLLIIVLIFGIIHLYWPNRNNSITVGLAAYNQDINDLKTTNNAAVMQQTKNYLKLIKELAHQGAAVVLLPEKIITTRGTYLPLVLNEFSQAAKKLHIILIVGLNQPDIYRNTATVIDKDGQTITNYYKQHLILFGSESIYQAGNKPGLFRQNGNLEGVAICHDLDFQKLGREYAKAGTQILFVPGLDFVADDWQHARIAIMRGIEGGYPVVRTAQWGLLTVSDDKGRVIASQKTSLTEPTSLIANVQLGSGNTFYSKTGDWFAWLCFILSIILVCYSFIRKKPS